MENIFEQLAEVTKPKEVLIKELQTEVKAMAEKWSEQMNELCNGKLAFQDSSRFSYIGDRLDQFTKELMEFEILNK